MVFTTLISTDDLAGSLNHPDWAIIDCRFSLEDTGRGRAAYRESHIPGAVYAHLDEDLSGLIIPGTTGRHPLPEVDVLGRTLSDWGIGEGVQVIAYDDMGGAIAARVWWLLRWLGHDGVAVLDGGFLKWVEEGRPVNVKSDARSPRRFDPGPRSEMIATVEEVLASPGDFNTKVVDSRVPERYRGEVEPIDPVAGHIPGAVNAPHPATIGEDGLYLKPPALREHFEAVLGDVSSENAIFYCGSGVTASRNLLAFAQAGFKGGRLYPGSWSEWIADPNRPIATG